MKALWVLAGVLGRHACLTALGKGSVTHPVPRCSLQTEISSAFADCCFCRLTLPSKAEQQYGPELCQKYISWSVRIISK